MAPLMIVPPVLDAEALLYHWYVKPVPVAVTVSGVPVWPVHMVCAADCGCMLITGLLVI